MKIIVKKMIYLHTFRNYSIEKVNIFVRISLTKPRGQCFDDKKLSPSDGGKVPLFIASAGQQPTKWVDVEAFDLSGDGL